MLWPGGGSRDRGGEKSAGKPAEWSRTGVTAICPPEKKADFGGSTGVNGLRPANTCNVQRALRFSRYCQRLIYIYAILLQNDVCFV
jgi:hypothetical protein